MGIFRTWKFYDFFLLFLAVFIDHLFRSFEMNSFVYWALEWILLFVEFLYLSLTVAELDEGSIILDLPILQKNVALLEGNFQEYFILFLIILGKALLIFSPLNHWAFYFVIPGFYFVAEFLRTPLLRDFGTAGAVLAVSTLSTQGFNSFLLVLLILTGTCSPLNIALLFLDVTQPWTAILAVISFVILREIKGNFMKICCIMLIFSKLGFFFVMGDCEYEEIERAIEGMVSIYGVLLFYMLFMQPKALKLSAQLFLDL